MREAQSTDSYWGTSAEVIELPSAENCSARTVRRPRRPQITSALNFPLLEPPIRLPEGRLIIF